MENAYLKNPEDECPIDVRKNRFKASFLEFKGYLDLLITIEALINGCIMATQGDHYSQSSVDNSGSDIRKTLEFVRQLLPIEEGEYLDECYNLLIKEP
ncbi:hypothetical protein JoomaDRAFT_1776 [Galbibacter orientalis DSM 19592]|uniref:Uncharacterized protein n=1 Tax=Galbibacter orientalis DSM 19592 TaxID=926559 RepID=I3C590_9FLAO|nr:hypothetical protein [Galbibacter orientalis]EIJ38783.1 hypothetical protein JoomaDRAFT_1776 [Galbibacter orientalis DSM 19592]